MISAASNLFYYTHCLDAYDSATIEGVLLPNARSSDQRTSQIVLSRIGAEDLTVHELFAIHEGILPVKPRYWASVDLRDVANRVVEDRYNQFVLRVPLREELEARIDAFGVFDAQGPQNQGFDPIAFMRSLGYLE
jgi:hypothetical protein